MESMFHKILAGLHFKFAHTTGFANQLDWLDLSIVVVFVMVVVIVGCYFTRKSSNPKQFTTAGGAISGWIVGLSIFGTYFSSISVLANPGSSFATNWNGYAFNISCLLATIIGVRYFIPYYRRCNSVSAYALFEEHIKGSITAGKLADLIILNEDPTKIKPHEIQELQIEMVILDGKIAFRKEL